MIEYAYMHALCLQAAARDASSSIAASDSVAEMGMGTSLAGTGSDTDMIESDGFFFK